MLPMDFPWTKKYRRRRLLAAPFPAEWLAYLHRNVALYWMLTEPEQQRLRDDLRIFIAEKKWEGCGGLTITDETKVTVAAQACLLLLGIEHDYFEMVQSVLVYPKTYYASRELLDEEGLIDQHDRVRLGEAWYRGPVVLTWDTVLRESRDPSEGSNLVLHEFAHQLDFLDGWTNGTPLLKTHEQCEQWRRVMTREHHRLIRDCRKGRPTVLDPYGASNPWEFFAVATECFFTQPVRLQERHPQLYQILREYYNQDTAARLARHNVAATDGTA